MSEIGHPQIREAGVGLASTAEPPGRIAFWLRMSAISE